MDYTQLKTAIRRFGEMLDAYRNNTGRPPLEQEAVQDSLIKRFEYTLEVAWKVCKKHLEEEGFAEASTGSPKSIIRLAVQRNLIDNPETWFNYLRFRQDALQDYPSIKSESLFDIAKTFYEDVVKLYRRMTGKSC
jgi:nucleotidyltransferase substrate binding protein (TIGR01987 family)